MQNARQMVGCRASWCIRRYLLSKLCYNVWKFSSLIPISVWSFEDVTWPTVPGCQLNALHFLRVSSMYRPPRHYVAHASRWASWLLILSLSLSLLNTTNSDHHQRWWLYFRSHCDRKLVSRHFFKPIPTDRLADCTRRRDSTSSALDDAWRRLVDTVEWRLVSHPLSRPMHGLLDSRLLDCGWKESVAAVDRLTSVRYLKLSVIYKCAARAGGLSVTPSIRCEINYFRAMKRSAIVGWSLFRPLTFWCFREYNGASAKLSSNVWIISRLPEFPFTATRSLKRPAAVTLAY